MTTENGMTVMISTTRMAGMTGIQVWMTTGMKRDKKRGMG